MRGILEHLSATLFELVIICSNEGSGLVRSEIRNKEIRLVTYPSSYDQIIETLRQEEFSILYYWEVATDSLNYFLPFMRLAPVQCTSWGIQVTTGIPTMDYYLSSALVESREC